MRGLLRAFIVEDDGATAIEYVLIAVMTAILAMGALTAFGQSVSSKFYFVATTIQTATNGGGS